MSASNITTHPDYGMLIFGYADGYQIYRRYDYGGGTTPQAVRYWLLDAHGSVNSWADKGHFAESLEKWDKLHGQRKRLNRY